MGIRFATINRILITYSLQKFTHDFTATVNAYGEVT